MDVSPENYRFRLDLVDLDTLPKRPIRGPSGARVVELEEDESQIAIQMADFLSRANDMQRAVEYAEQYLALMDDDSVPDAVKESLWESALIRYGRSFANDIRTHGNLKLSALDSLPGEPREVHRHFLDVRNKYVAHSENPYEDVLIGLVLAEYPSLPAVVGIQAAHTSATRFTKEGIELLILLARTFGDWATEEAHRLQLALLARARRLNVVRVYERPDLMFNRPVAVDAAARRKRPRPSNG